MDGLKKISDTHLKAGCSKGQSARGSKDALAMNMKVTDAVI